MFKLHELLLEVVDLNHVQGRLVSQEVLVLAVHDVLDGLFGLI